MPGALLICLPNRVFHVQSRWLVSRNWIRQPLKYIPNETATAKDSAFSTRSVSQLETYGFALLSGKCLEGREKAQ